MNISSDNASKTFKLWIPMILWREGRDINKGIDHLQTYESNHNQELIVVDCLQKQGKITSHTVS